jgi:protease II
VHAAARCLRKRYFTVLQVWRHEIGSDPSEDVLVFHEEDPSFNVGVYLSRSNKFIFIETGALELFLTATQSKIPLPSIRLYSGDCP